MIEDLGERRREAVEGIDLEDAVETLSELAADVRIRCSNEVLRVLWELKELQERGPGGPIREAYWRIVRPDQRNATQEHIQPPVGQDAEKTFCGYDPEGWPVVDRVPSEELEALLERDSLCERCRTSLKRQLWRLG